MRNVKLQIGICALIAISGAVITQTAFAKTMTVVMQTPACNSWAGWREWVQASLRPNGARFNQHCPTSIAKGTKVDVIEDDDGQGVARVKWRGKEWYTHADRLK